MAVQTLEPQDHGRDAQFAHAMHGKSGTMRGGLTSLFRKNSETMKSAVDGYFKYWTGKSIGDQTVSYYDAFLSTNSSNMI
jgi:sterol 24-C-methyltransferase